MPIGRVMKRSGFRTTCHIGIGAFRASAERSLFYEAPPFEGTHPRVVLKEQPDDVRVDVK
jgi:hypothetical protein